MSDQAGSVAREIPEETVELPAAESPATVSSISNSAGDRSRKQPGSRPTELVFGIFPVQALRQHYGNGVLPVAPPEPSGQLQLIGPARKPMMRARTQPGPFHPCLPESINFAIPQLLLSSACAIVLTMKASPTAVFPHRGLAPHQFTPMSGARKTLHPTAARPARFRRHRKFRRPIRCGRLTPAAVGELLVRRLARRCQCSFTTVS